MTYQDFVSKYGPKKGYLLDKLSFGLGWEDSIGSQGLQFANTAANHRTIYERFGGGGSSGSVDTSLINLPSRSNTRHSLNPGVAQDGTRFFGGDHQLPFGGARVKYNPNSKHSSPISNVLFKGGSTRGRVSGGSSRPETTSGRAGVFSRSSSAEGRTNVRVRSSRPKVAGKTQRTLGQNLGTRTRWLGRNLSRFGRRHPLAAAGIALAGAGIGYATGRGLSNRPHRKQQEQSMWNNPYLRSGIGAGVGVGVGSGIGYAIGGERGRNIGVGIGAAGGTAAGYYAPEIRRMFS